MKRLRQKLILEMNFKGSISSLRTIVRNLGFKFTKTRDDRAILKEQPKTVASRAHYLRLLAQYRSENKYISYVDETYLHATHCGTKQWSDKSKKGFFKKTSKGRRIIIVHGGGSYGFVDNGLLMFTSGSKSGDYHDDMNFENFSKWLKEKYLPNLPPNSVIVLDNASYHNVHSEKVPNMSSRKIEMIDWLKARNIGHDEKMYKSELYCKILDNKPDFIKYKIDDVIKAAGHTVLRLPPYHPDLNPIEAIWALVKNAVAKRNVTGKLKDVQKLALEEFAKVSVEDWRKRCQHVYKVEEFYRNVELNLS